jgi:hypothetical protein
MVKEFCESILVDAELHRYRPSFLITAAWSAMIELKTNEVVKFAESDDPKKEIIELHYA